MPFPNAALIPASGTSTLLWFPRAGFGMAALTEAPEARAFFLLFKSAPLCFQARDGTRPRTSIAEGAGCSCCSSTYQCFLSSACVTIPQDTTSQQHSDVELFTERKEGPELLLPPWKQNPGRGRTAAVPAEVTLAKESLIQVTGTITTPAEMQIFFTV